MSPIVSPHLAVLDRALGIVTFMTLDTAEVATQIDKFEIERAIEACGVCLSMDYEIRDTRPAIDAV